MAHGIAPIGVARRAADSADLEGVVCAGCQAIHGHGAGVGEEAAILPRAGRAALADGGVTHFITAGIGDGTDAEDELAGVGIEDVADRRHGERRLRAVGAHGVEAAGEQRGEVVATVFLHITGELAEQIDEDVAFVVLIGRRRRAALLLRADGGAESVLRRLQRDGSDGRRGIGGVAVEVLEDFVGRLDETEVRSIGEAELDAEVGHMFWGWWFREKSVPRQPRRIPA